jgi:hypothetical protein
VTPEFVNEIKAEGFSALTPRDLINLKIYKIDADYIRRVKSKGFADVTLKQLINLRIYKVAE